MEQMMKLKDAPKDSEPNGMVIDYRDSSLSLGFVEAVPGSQNRALQMNLMYNYEGLYKMIHEFPLGERNLRNIHKMIGDYLETGKFG